jgi:SNF2 family DNA or RNA helicase
MVEEFQNSYTKKIMIISLKAGGTGLNLTAANHVIHYDLWWNPAVENQATDRAFRIGQKKNVMVHRLISMGTFEEKINDLLKAKQQLADLSVSVGENWITEMSNEELRGVFGL